MVLIEEAKLEQTMREEVGPYLRKLLTKGKLRNELYYELFRLPDKARGTLVISHGSTESCIKFHEFIYYALREGYNCAVMDHRGHGFSLREGKDPGVIHVKDFALYAGDLHEFVHSAVLPELGGPLYLYGHSMGGCIAADYLERWPGDFEKAILNAPMLGLDMGKIPSWAGLLFGRLMCLLGKGEEKLFFQNDFSPDKTVEDSCATSPARFNWYHSLRCAEPALQQSASSYAWAVEAIRASKKVMDNAERVSVPVLMFQAEKDGLVSPEAQEKFVKKLRNGKLIKVADSRHEIYRSENRVLKDYYGQIFDFLSEKE